MTSKEQLRSFCQDISDDITKRKDQSESESSVLLHTYNEKCKAILDQIKAKDDKEIKDDIQKILRDISQLVLDVTYVQEIELVEDDFSHEDAELVIKSIIDSLSSVEALAEKVCPERNVISSLGPEIVECLQWRKGALLYMYCHTIHHQNSGQGKEYLHYLEEGVNYLQAMLKTRCAAAQPGENPSVSKDDEQDTLHLVEEGIFSDTHLLALMYCGEMCYWHALSIQGSTTTVPKDDTGNSVSTQQKDQIHVQDESHLRERNSVDTCDKIPGVIKNEKKAVLECTNNSSNSEKDQQSDSSTGSKTCLRKNITGEDGASNCKGALHSSIKKSAKKESSFPEMVAIGNSCLKRYLSITKGPLSWAGWSTDRAEDLISYLKKLDIQEQKMT